MTSEATRRRIEGNIERSYPDPIPEVPLRERDTADLLTAAYALTHRLHEGCPSSVTTEPLGRIRWAQEVRAQRDLITAEVERRTQACTCCDGRC